MRFRAEFPPQGGDQADVLGLGAGQQQRIEAQDDRLVVILPGAWSAAWRVMRWCSCASVSLGPVTRLPCNPPRRPWGRVIFSR